MEDNDTTYNFFFYATADEAVVYMFYRCLLVFFQSAKNMRQPFSGMAERIFINFYQTIPGKMEFATSCRRLANGEC